MWARLVPSAPFGSPVELPQSHGTIVAPTGQQPRGTANQRPDPAAVSLQSAHALPGFSLLPEAPQFHAAIKTATG